MISDPLPTTVTHPAWFDCNCNNLVYSHRHTSSSANQPAPPDQLGTPEVPIVLIQ